MGRVTNALEVAKEFKDAGDDIELIFDGAGTQWVEELSDKDHGLHDLYMQVKNTAGACKFCADAFDADISGVDVLDDHDDHPSIRSLVADDYEIITF